MLEHRPSQELEIQENTIDEIKLSVAKLCQDFPGEILRELDTKQEYPTKFVQALTESGFLGVLIPEEYGGSGLGIVAASKILEENYIIRVVTLPPVMHKCIQWELF